MLQIGSAWIDFKTWPHLGIKIYSSLNSNSTFNDICGFRLYILIIYLCELLFRNAQRNLNRKVNDYMRKIVSSMNDITSTSTGGFIPMADLKVIWDDVVSFILSFSYYY